jgi:hypothetical protein
VILTWKKPARSGSLFCSLTPQPEQKSGGVGAVSGAEGADGGEEEVARRREAEEEGRATAERARLVAGGDCNPLLRVGVKKQRQARHGWDCS